MIRRKKLTSVHNKKQTIQIRAVAKWKQCALEAMAHNGRRRESDDDGAYIAMHIKNLFNF